MNSATFSQLLKGNQNFRRLWVGQVISELGTWFSFIAELGVVRLLSGSAWATTALLVARMIPFLLVAPVAGVIVDRCSRKRIMIVTDLLRALVALAYLIAVPYRAVWIIVVCSALMSSLSMFFEAAKNAATPNMVTANELLTANVLMFSTRFLQYALGAALGGVTTAKFGYNAAFLINALSFVASALFIWAIPAAIMHKAGRRTPAPDVAKEMADQLPAPLSAESGLSAPIAGSEQPVERSRRGFFVDLREGLAYVRTTPFVRAIILINVAWASGGGMVNLLFDQMGGHTFTHAADNRGDWNVAALFTASGIGLFIGMTLARRIGMWVNEEGRAGHFIGWSLLAQGLLMSAAGLMPSLAGSAVLVALSRLVLGAEFGVQETLLMRVLPDEYRGRVFTTDRSLEWTTMSLATLIGGWLLAWFNAPTVMVIAGGLSASPGLAWLLAMWLARFRVPAHAFQEG